MDFPFLPPQQLSEEYTNCVFLKVDVDDASVSAAHTVALSNNIIGIL